MKIAMLIDGWKPILWWWQVHVEELCKWLVENHNCMIDLFVRKLKSKTWKKYIEDESSMEGKWRIFRYGPTTTFFNFWGRLLSLITITVLLFLKSRKERYDVIHAHAYVSGLPARIVWSLLHIPVVYTVHGTMSLDNWKKNVNYYIENFLVNKIVYDLEISVSNNILRYKNSNNIVVIHNGVCVERFDKICIEKKYAWLNFLWVWRFNWQKWLSYLLEWISLIDKKLLEEKDFVLNLVWDGELFEEMKTLSSKLWISDFVNFKWRLDWKILLEEYKKNHVFILPSLAEWQPLTVLEAFASKLTVIATDVGDNKYFIDKNNWYLIKPRKKEEIRDILKDILQMNKEKISIMWNEWYNLVNKKYTWDIMIWKTFDCYYSLVENSV